MVAVATVALGGPTHSVAETGSEPTLSPGISPPGANVAACEPRGRRAPVVLIHGTRSDMTINWQYISPQLAQSGWCVWALDLEARGTVAIERSATRLARFVRQVRRQSGSERISLVGHSLGGVVARHFVRFLGGRKRVDDVVSFGTPQYGYHSDPPLNIVDAGFNTGCVACWQLAQSSGYMERLNSGNPIPGPVSYTQLITRNDAVATPVENQELPVSRRSVNIYLEDACPDHSTDHLSMAIDPLVLGWIENALIRRGPANQHRAVSCP